MKLAPQEISIRDWHKLTRETHRVVDEAINYLESRRPATQTKDREIKKWKERLQKHSLKLENIRSGYEKGLFKKAKPGERRAFITFNNRVQRSGKQVQDLSNQSYVGTTIVLKNLEAHLKNFMSVGPHGPGGGKPKPGTPNPYGPGSALIKGTGKKGTEPKRSASEGGLI